MQNSQENPLVEDAEYGTKKASYKIDVEHAEKSKELSALIEKINALELKKRQLMEEIAATAELPNGWRRQATGCNAHRGSVEVTCTRSIVMPPAPERKVTPLQKLTQYVDIKTLFNSGILTPAQKRLLLNVDAIVKEAEQANEKV